MTYRIVFRPSVQAEIQRQGGWIREKSRSPATAFRWVRSILAEIDSLRTSPFRCPVDPDSAIFGEESRVLVVGKRRGKYRVVFVIRDDVVLVVSIRHAAQRSLAEEMEADDDEPTQ